MGMYYGDMPEGVTFIGDIEWDNEAYQFDMTGIWKTKRGEYWIGDDSGCSCPSPFENVHGIDDLDGPYNKAGLRSALESRIKEGSHGRSEAELRKEVFILLDYLK